MYLAFLVPLQVLVLTHELADISGSDNFKHLCEIFSPMIPVVMYGRTAKLGTTVNKEETVWYGWSWGKWQQSGWSSKDGQWWQ